MSKIISEGQPEAEDGQKRRREANACLSLGVGVGVLGAAGALTGAVCPLCVVIAPALVGAGLVGRLRSPATAKNISALDPTATDDKVIKKT